jgi:hypothetical protein
MIKLIKTTTALALISLVMTSSAQVLSFEKNTHDFGVASEEVGNLVYEFKFTNKGDKPLVISNVQPACGCTTTGWTKEPVQPGESGMVSASYSAKGRVGKFDKTLSVKANGQPAEVTLHIKGNVTPQPITSAYPDSVGILRVKNFRDLNFAKIDATKTSATQTIEVANPQKTAISIAFENVPDYLKVTAEPVNLNSQQKGIIRVSVDGTKRKSYGYVKDAITIKVGETKRTLTVSSIVSESFPGMTGVDIDNGPSMVVADTINFGKGKNAVITVKNAGKADLILKSFTSSNQFLSISQSKAVKIKPDKSADIKVACKNIKGLNGSKIYLGTNDAHNPLAEINVKAAE